MTSIHDFTTTPSPDIKVSSDVTLAGAALGIHKCALANLSGAVGSMDFGGTPWLTYTVTGNLSGSFTFPPINTPALAADNLQYVFVVEFVQDATGGRTINLSTLFANAARRVGISVADLTPGGVTQVLLVARRTGGTTSWTAHLQPWVDGGQIIGTIPSARVQAGGAGTAGVLALGTSAAAAAAGNHIHTIPETRPILLEMSGGGALTAGDYPIFKDMHTGGRIVRITKLRFRDGTNPAATATMKIGTNAVSGISVAVGNTDSGDGTATANNTFAARQSITLTLAGVTGSPTRMEGVLHVMLNSDPTT